MVLRASWIGLCYLELGMMNKAMDYIDKTKKIIPLNWEVPELYIGGRDVPNGNTPLAWSVSLSYLFLEKTNMMRMKKLNEVI